MAQNRSSLRRLKIGLVLDDTLDTPDGVQQYVLQVGRWLTEQGHEVHYLVGATTRTDLDGLHSLSRNVSVRFNGNRMSIPLPASRRKLKEFLANNQFDIIHVQVPYSPFLAGRLLNLLPKTTAVIGTFHILPYSSLVRRANRALGVINRLSSRRFDRMLAVSEPAKEFAEKIYGYTNIIVVPNPIRLSQFEDIKSDDPELNITFLGRLVERKGALQLLKAINYLRINELFKGDFAVHIGGKGQLLPNLEQYVKTNRLTDIVQFHGFISEDDKADYLAAADIVAYPSMGGESFGIVLLEAMAATRGVVLAGNNPGYSSVMQPFKSQLFDPLDVPALAHLIAKYLANQPGRHKLSEVQHDYVKSFDINKVGNQLESIYNQALQIRWQA
ncbi:MAG: glycosyltransferase family 4 protein [Candidatus Saccharimonadales bacterium]